MGSFESGAKDDGTEGSCTCTSGADIVRVASCVDDDAARAVGIADSARLRVMVRIGLLLAEAKDNGRSVPLVDTPRGFATAARSSCPVERRDRPLRSPTDGSQPPVEPGLELRCMEDASGAAEVAVDADPATTVLAELFRCVVGASSGVVRARVTGGRLGGGGGVVLEELE